MLVLFSCRFYWYLVMQLSQAFSAIFANDKHVFRLISWDRNGTEQNNKTTEREREGKNNMNWFVPICNENVSEYKHKEEKIRIAKKPMMMEY